MKIDIVGALFTLSSSKLIYERKEGASDFNIQCGTSISFDITLNIFGGTLKMVSRPINDITYSL